MTSLGARLGEGRTAEVFAYGPDRVVKLLRPGFSDALAESEAAIAARLAGAGAAAPRCDGVVRIGGRAGIVYELIPGPTMDARVRTHLWELDRRARQLGALHVAVHATAGNGLPSQRPAMHEAIERARPLLAATLVTAAHARVDRLDGGTSLCHGDLHPGNVLLGNRAVAIDWDNASSGSAAADIARSIFLMRDAAMPDAAGGPTGWVVRAIRARFARVYLSAYRTLRPMDDAEVAAWRLPILVARLGEGIAAEEAALRRDIELDVGATVRSA